MNKQIYKNYLIYSNTKLMNPVKAFKNFAAQFFGGQEKMNKVIKESLKDIKELLIEGSKTILPSINESTFDGKPLDEKDIRQIQQKK